MGGTAVNGFAMNPGERVIGRACLPSRADGGGRGPRFGSKNSLEPPKGDFPAIRATKCA
jgi:hypothetical protein